MCVPVSVSVPRKLDTSEVEAGHHGNPLPRKNFPFGKGCLGGVILREDADRGITEYPERRISQPPNRLEILC